MEATGMNDPDYKLHPLRSMLIYGVPATNHCIRRKDVESRADCFGDFPMRPIEGFGAISVYETVAWKAQAAPPIPIRGRAM